MVRLVQIVGYFNELRPIQYPLTKTNESELKHTQTLYLGLDVHKAEFDSSFWILERVRLSLMQSAMNGPVTYLLY